MESLRPRAAILDAYQAALGAADPVGAVQRAFRRNGSVLECPGGRSVDLASVARVRLLAGGKASGGLARGILELLGDSVSDGVVTLRDADEALPPRFDTWIGGHPLPSAGSLAAAGETLRYAAGCAPADLLVCALSGGASALWCAPPAGVTLEEIRAMNSALLASGAPIDRMNVVRKQVSEIAGGRLATRSSAGRLITVAISDVLDAGPDTIGSGPTLPNTWSAADALSVLEEWTIEVPTSVRHHLQRQAALPTAGAWPGAADPADFFVVASLDDALAAAERRLRERGFETRLVDPRLQGEARDVGRAISAAAVGARGGEAPLALIWGGEATVTLRGRGRGGRNQEAALSAAIALADVPEVTIGFLATDGSDGPTDAAGGWADGSTITRGMASGGDPHRALEDNDAYRFLLAAGDLVPGSATGTNVNDVVIAIVGRY
jgi:glycerate 2-kinase